MKVYYFDIETYSPSNLPDPEKDKIITIQYMPFDSATGEPLGRLIILKEWETSEEEIIKFFYNRFFKNKKVWDFVPAGFNLNFEWEFIKAKFQQYLNVNLTSRDLHYNRPSIDLKSIVVMLNKGEFKGAKLSRFSLKSHDGNMIRIWYEAHEYDRIIRYIEEEAHAYIEFYKTLMEFLQNFNYPL